MRAARAALLALALVAAVGASAGEPANRPTVPLDVVVVVFDSSGLLDASRLAGMLDETIIDAGAVYYRVTYAVVAAPGWAVEGLAGDLEGLYDRRGPPPWAPPEAPAPGGYAWLPLGPALESVGRWASAAARASGADGYDVLVAVLGDLDGASRVYYGGPGGLEGVRAWGPGATPLWVLDLSTVPAPTPGGDGLGGCAPGARPVGPTLDPPIWALDDPEAYTARAVEAYVRGVAAGPAPAVPSPTRVAVVVVALDGSRPEVDEGAVSAALSRLAPWAGVEAVVYVREPPAWLSGFYESLKPLGPPVPLGYAAVHAYAALEAERAAARCGCGAAAVILYSGEGVVLESAAGPALSVTPGPGVAVAAAPPGVPLEVVAVHAAARALGLEPPEAAAGDWLASQAPSPSSCNPYSVAAFMEWGSYHYTARVAAATAASTAGPGADGLLAGGDPIAAVLASLGSSAPQAPAGRAWAAATPRPPPPPGWAEAQYEGGAAPGGVEAGGGVVGGRPAPEPGEPGGGGLEAVAYAAAAFASTAWIGLLGYLVARRLARGPGGGG